MECSNLDERMECNEVQSCDAQTLYIAALLAQTETASGTWEIVPSPNGAKCKMPYPLCLTPEAGNVLYATAALSSNDVWAVGAEPHQSAVLTATLAEHWDGT